MTDHTSATGGYLTPDSDGPQPLEGDKLVDFLQSVVVGCTGLDGQWVRPRWQPEPPNLPAADQNWCAVGTIDRVSDTYAVVTHDGDGEGADNLQRQQDITMLCSFYGPDADSYAELLRDGLQIAQNREALQLANMAVKSTGDAVPAPSLVKERWLYRIDVRVTFTRQINRRYPVLNLLSAEGSIERDQPVGETPFIVEQ